MTQELQEILDTTGTRISADASTRRWTHQLGDLQNRARKVKNNGAPMAAAVADLLDDAVTFCATLLQELAGAQLQHARIQAEARQTEGNWQYLFDRLPLAALITDTGGTIVSANRAAALLLNMSAKHLVGKPLLHFVDSRQKLASTLHAAAAGVTRVEETLTVRPKERATREMTIVIVPESSEQADHFLWFLPQGFPPARARSVDAAPDGALQHFSAIE